MIVRLASAGWTSRMWYDVFSLYYDFLLEGLYRPFRETAVRELRLTPGARALDLPCGTGQSLDLLVSAVGPTGKVLGVDLSKGMLRKARRRVDRGGWQNVVLRQAPAAEVDSEFIAGAMGQPRLDGVLCALGLSVLPNWESVIDSLFSLLRPGGRFVIFDVYANKRTMSRRAVELGARADLSRKLWLPLEARCNDFQREVFPSDPKKVGGELYAASGTR